MQRTTRHTLALLSLTVLLAACGDKEGAEDTGSGDSTGADGGDGTDGGDGGETWPTSYTHHGDVLNGWDIGCDEAGVQFHHEINAEVDGDVVTTMTLHIVDLYDGEGGQYIEAHTFPVDGATSAWLPRWLELTDGEYVSDSTTRYGHRGDCFAGWALRSIAYDAAGAAMDCNQLDFGEDSVGSVMPLADCNPDRD